MDLIESVIISLCVLWVCLKVRTPQITITGWWFGTFFIFPYTNWEESSQLTFIFFRGVGQPPTRLWAREVMMNRRSSRPLFETRPRYSRVSGAWSDVAAVEWRWPWGRARPNGKTGWVYTVEDQQLEYGKIKLPCLTWVQDISVFICCWVALIHT